MSEEQDIDTFITALRQVPTKRLLLLELAAIIPIHNGVFDYEELKKHQHEIMLATAEAKAYGSYTLMAVDALSRLKAIPEGGHSDVR